MSNALIKKAHADPKHGHRYLHVVVVETEDAVSEVRQHVAQLVNLAVCVEQSVIKQIKAMNMRQAIIDGSGLTLAFCRTRKAPSRRSPLVRSGRGRSRM